MGSKRPSAKGAAIWWLLSFAIASFFAWLFWHTAKVKPIPANAPGTNTLDRARATNLLQWLNTNTAIRTTNLVSTNPIVPPPTNRLPITLRYSTNISLPKAIKSMTNLSVTNLFSTPVQVKPPIERPVRSMLEAQIALARQAISAGPIDGVAGSQTHAALRAYQKQNHLRETGDLDPATRAALLITEPVYTNYTVTLPDLARLHPLPATWLGKSEQESLEYQTILELVAERHQSSQPLIKSLNPSINWTNVSPLTNLKVPNVYRTVPKRRAAFIRIALAAKTLEAFDSDTNLLAHFPCSIAARVEKRPVGQLTVVTGAENPNYTFDPEVFPESEEARQIDHKLIIPPGPNNPVGVAWITLDKPGYGIHGTPRPEQVGRTESHGCFRLANWNAEYLLKIVWAGLPIYVEP